MKAKGQKNQAGVGLAGVCLEGPELAWGHPGWQLNCCVTPPSGILGLSQGPSSVLQPPPPGSISLTVFTVLFSPLDASYTALGWCLPGFGLLPLRCLPTPKTKTVFMYLL